MRIPGFMSGGKLKMRDSLFGYMMILTAVILIVISFGMLLLGTFTKPADSFSDTLELQLEMFAREINSHHEELAMRGARLSEESSQLVKQYLDENGIKFNNLLDSPEHLLQIQEIMLTVLKDELLMSDSSGAFILLNSTVNSKTQCAKYQRTGIYLQRASQIITDETLLMYRGSSAVGKQADIMPHRKWQLEFDTRLFPNYSEIMNTSPDIPLEKAYSFTDVMTMPGTGERVSLLALPIRGDDGQVWGICGFELGETSFKINHAQPSTLDRLMCIWAPIEDNSVDMNGALSCGTDEGYYLPPVGTLDIRKSKDGLSRFDGEKLSYIGAMRVVDNQFDKHLLAVMIPKEDYDKAISTNTVQIVVFLILLCSFAISLCRILSKRFITPIITGLEQIRLYEHTDSASGLLEMDDLFAFLAQKDKELECAYESLTEEKEKAQTELARVQTEIDKLSYSRKSEINPDDYENFVTGIKMLTKAERNIFEMYLDGKTAKEITEATGIKESTLKFHNGNIYGKLGVSSRKQMLRYAALYSNENGGKI